MSTKDNRNRKVTVRFTDTEYNQLKKKFQNSVGSQASHYIRSIVLEKPVLIKYRNDSLDRFMEEIILLRQELNAIGNNFNQSVKKLHTLKLVPEFRAWIASNEQRHEVIIAKTALIQQRIDQISQKWLQE